MLLAKHFTEDEDGTELSSEYLPKAFENRAEAEAAILEAQEKFDRCGVDDEQARWWARDESGVVHYWWIEAK